MMGDDVQQVLDQPIKRIERTGGNLKQLRQDKRQLYKRNGVQFGYDVEGRQKVDNEPDGLPYEYSEYLLEKDCNYELEITEESSTEEAANGENLAADSKVELSNEILPQVKSTVKENDVHQNDELRHSYSLPSYSPDTAAEQVGEQTEDAPAKVELIREYFDQYKHIKDHLRTTAVTLSQQDQPDIGPSAGDSFAFCPKGQN